MAGIMHKVVVQKWEVSERGSRSEYDSCTLHLNEHDRAQFIADHHDSLPNVTPESYVYAYGAPYIGEVDDATLVEITGSKNGIRRYGSSVPEISGPMIIVIR